MKALLIILVLTMTGGCTVAPNTAHPTIAEKFDRIEASEYMIMREDWDDTNIGYAYTFTIEDRDYIYFETHNNSDGTLLLLK